MDGAQRERARAAPSRAAETKTEVRSISRIATAALIAAFPAAAPHHRPGCNTAKCDKIADTAWNRHEEEERRRREARLARRFPRIALCVANRESGVPGSLSVSTIRWDYDDGTFEGSMNWENSTWRSQSHGRFGPFADRATPSQQVRVFMENANSHDWPRTYPACGG